MYKTLISLFVVLFLTACSSSPKIKEVVVEKTKQVIVVPPSELTKDCDVPAPSEKEVYLRSTDKEKLLTDNIIDLYGSIASCNKQLSGLRIWFDKQKANFDKP